ncbi:MAG TPA: haloacid dehalogenase, partial [Actinomycetota bacterium]|nr:haloacid dehalogenase [Actinomycetota bacterium]
MPLPREVKKEATWVTTDCYGTLIDWERGIADAFRQEATVDGFTIDEAKLLERFFPIQEQIMAGSYELYAEVLRRTAVRVAKELG